MNPLISVIVPVYKVEPYLCQCVDSILAQTYKKLEIILVDDGSPDRCPQICDDYAKKDERIRVIHKENGGVSDARNAGLDIVTGEYIGFVDSDDWIAPEMYEGLIRSLLKYNADIAACGYQESNGKRTVATKSMARQEKSYTVEEAFREVLLSGEISVTMCNNIYTRRLFQNIRFPVGEIYEDRAIFYQLFGKSSIICHCGTNGYFYRKGHDSITRSTDFQDLKKAITRNYLACEAYILEKYPSLSKEVLYYSAEEHYYLLAKCLQSRASVSEEELQKLKGDLWKRRRLVLTHPKWSVLKKTKVLLMLSGAYEPAWQLYHRIRKI